VHLQCTAYCSLAGSLVQACLRHPQLGRGLAVHMLTIASQLAEVCYAWAADFHEGSSSSSGSSNVTCASWVLVFELAGVVAAGSYTVHMMEDTCSDPGPIEAALHANISSTSSSASASGSAPATSGAAGSPTCPVDCAECLIASGVLGALQSVESHCVLPRASIAAMQALYARAAHAYGTSLQEYLRECLLTLSWRHPMLFTCGNALCGRLEGPSAVAAVMNWVGTLCGGCMAARYCCKECQRVAWQRHDAVCRPPESAEA
jgi:hypothetical protein